MTIDVASPPLFRPEALAHRRHGLTGEVLVRVEPGWAAIGWLMVAVVVAAAVFLMSSRFSRKETVPGVLVSHPDTVKVRALKPGTIASVHVRPGDEVAAGQVLFVVDVDPIDAGGRQVAEAQLAGLEAEAAALARQKALEQDLAQKRAAELGRRLSGLDQQIAAAMQSQRLQERTNGLLADQVEAIADLAARGFATKVELRRRQAEL